MNISVVIITKNEEENLARTLKSVAWCDEIIVVDSGSTDNTIEIAKQFGAKVFYNTFEGFGKQKAFAVNHAKNNWILNIDADEVVSDELRNSLLTFSTINVASGYIVSISHHFLGTKFRFGRECTLKRVRFFNKEKGNFNDSKVHEKVELQGNIETLNGELIHHSYKSIKHYFEKFNQYTDNAAFELHKKKKRRPLLLNSILFPFYFINIYLIQLNILNGVAGLVWSLFSAFYTYVKYCKLEELVLKDTLK